VNIFITFHDALDSGQREVDVVFEVLIGAGRAGEGVRMGGKED